jgi:integrase
MRIFKADRARHTAPFWLITGIFLPMTTTGNAVPRPCDPRERSKKIAKKSEQVMTSKIKLTDALLGKLKASGPPGEYMDTVTSGLGVRVSPKGKIAFFIYTRLPGANSSSRHGLGQWCTPGFTLAEARKKASEWKGQISQGTNPVQEIKRRRAEEARQRDETFRSVVSAWQAALIKSGRDAKSTQRRVNDLERDWLPTFGDRSIRELTQSRGEIRQFLIEMPSSASAQRLHTILSSIFSWAIENDVYGLGNATNPCMGIKASSYGYKRSYDTRIISDEQFRALWSAADEAGYPWGPFLKFVALTVGRNAECMVAQWPEIDFDKKLWTIPKEHTKTRQEIIKPLSNAATELVASLPRDIESAVMAVKPGPNPRRGLFRRYYDPTRLFGLRPMDTAYGSQASRSSPKDNIDRYLPEELRDWTFHRFRHTFKTFMAANSRLVVHEAVEMYLSHGHKNQMELHYNMHKYQDEMRQVAELWAQEIMRKVNTNPSAPNVVNSFRKRLPNQGTEHD